MCDSRLAEGKINERKLDEGSEWIVDGSDCRVVSLFPSLTLVQQWRNF